MYGELRTRQALNKPSILICRSRQCLSTLRNPSLLAHASRQDAPRTPPLPVQRRSLGNFNHGRKNGPFSSSGRSVITGTGRGQNVNSRLLTYSQNLCATESQEYAKTASLFDAPIDLKNPRDNDGETDKVELNIRDRLRLWEANHPDGAAKEFMADLSKPGDIQNHSMKGAVGDNVVDPFTDDTIEDTDKSVPFFERGELVDLGNSRPFLLRGDMVELNLSRRRQPELAIFVREIGSHAQFYTMSGKWVNRTARSVLFYVPKFVAPKELDDLLPYLPAADLPPAEQNKLQSFKNAPPRDVGGRLVRKLLDFWNQTEAVFRQHAEILDRAHQAVASKDVLQYYTLEEVAKKLLPQSVKKLPNGQFPISVLYAVHRALMQESSGIRPRRSGFHRYGSQYEVSPKIETHIVMKVTDYVRKFQENQVIGKNEDSGQLASFIARARRLIDQSREHREVTNSGTLGPYTTATDTVSLKMQRTERFSSTDIEIIRFMEYWAAMLFFKTDSSSHAIGSLILRAVGRYPGFELDMTTCWTFMQEIGVLAPWDNKIAFDLRLPNARLQLGTSEDHTEPEVETTSDLSLTDRMKALRKDWASVPIYCIDDAGAHEIDDGVSLELIEDSPDEFWIHIHTADPASHIDPSSDLARKAEHMTSTLYLPERLVPMIPRNITLEQFSLANDRPCLTFSARLNNDGDILSTKITPGYVRNVKFITPSVVEEVVEGTSSPKMEGDVYTVGSSISPFPDSNSKPERNMLQANELSEEDKANLRRLHSLGLARRQRGWQRGALPPAASAYLHNYNSGSTISVQLDTLHPSSLPHHYEGDPTIEIRTSAPHNIEDGQRQQTVTNLMLLGGEIAARWCSERRIPIPYRVTPQNPSKPDPAKYLREILLPALKSPDKDTFEKVTGYLETLGSVNLSATPGPHLALGVSKFAKCTSPLRRYGDLLVHWQVEAALLEEAKTGQSLVNSTSTSHNRSIPYSEQSVVKSLREDYLPFSTEAIEELIPSLDGRERLVRMADKDAKIRWAIQFVLRAWKYKQCAIPQTFECQLRRPIADGMTAWSATIKFLGIEGRFNVPEWIKGDELKQGDVYECEFEDVNMYMKKIDLKPLRRV